MNQKLPDQRSEVVFEDFKKAYTEEQAAAEANRCLYCYDALLSPLVQLASISLLSLDVSLMKIR